MALFIDQVMTAGRGGVEREKVRGKKSLLGAQKEEGRGRRGRGSKYLKRSRVSRKKGEEKGGGFFGASAAGGWGEGEGM